MLMNVLYFLTTVIKTQTARTLMARSCALVTMDTLEMEPFVMVRKLLEVLSRRKSRIVTNFTITYILQ